MEIIPAVLSKTFEEVVNNLSHVQGISDTVQIDICDGIFGAEETWIPNGKDVLPFTFSYEFDIMLQNWKIPTAQCLLLKAKSIVLHVDNFTDDDIDMLIAMVKPYDVRLGISVSNNKELEFHIEMIRKILKKYENIFIQVMGIRNVGQQGQPFDTVAPSRIAFLKHMFPGILIQVDGGVKIETIKLLKDSGVDSVVVGSYLVGALNVQLAFKTLQSI